MWILRGCLLVYFIWGTTAYAVDASTLAMRKAFLQAELYINQNRDGDYFALADSLKAYPLYPYLHYQYLKNHLDDNEAVMQFVHDFAQSRYAALLQQKWLLQKAQQQQWLIFINQYRHSDDDMLRCYYPQALFYTGQQDLGIEAARKLWLAGKTLPTACDATFELLKASPLFNQDLIWQRFQTALLASDAKLASQLANLLTPPLRNQAEIWLKLHHQPQHIKTHASWKPDDAQAGLLFAHSIVRWLDIEPIAALEVWDAEKTVLPSTMKPVPILKNAWH